MKAELHLRICLPLYLPLCRCYFIKFFISTPALIKPEETQEQSHAWS